MTWIATSDRPYIVGGHIIMLSRDDATLESAMEACRAYPGGLQVGPECALRRGIVSWKRYLRA